MVKKISFICFLLLTVLWICFIFSNSLDNGVESGEKSSAVTTAVNNVLSALGFDSTVPEGVIRTLGHFSEFAALSLLVCVDLLLSPIPCDSRFCRSPLFLLTATPFCFTVACIDELIQNFSAGRAMQISDVLVDTLGALCVCAVLTLIRWLIYAKRQTKSTNNL